MRVSRCTSLVVCNGSAALLGLHLALRMFRGCLCQSLTRTTMMLLSSHRRASLPLGFGPLSPPSRNASVDSSFTMSENEEGEKASAADLGFNDGIVASKHGNKHGKMQERYYRAKRQGSRLNSHSSNKRSRLHTQTHAGSYEALRLLRNLEAHKHVLNLMADGAHWLQMAQVLYGFCVSLPAAITISKNVVCFAPLE